MNRWLRKSVLLFAFAAPMVNATIFNESNMSSSAPSEMTFELSLFERGDSSAWLIETYKDNSDGSFKYMMKTSDVGRQDGSLLVDKGELSTNDLTALLMLSDGETPVFAGGAVAPESGSWVLYNVEKCQDGSCETLRTYRIFLDSNGYPDSLFGQLSVEEVEKPKCKIDSATSLTFNDEAIFRHLGCGEFSKYNYLFVEDESFESSPNWSEDFQSKGVNSSKTASSLSYLLHSEGENNTPYFTVAEYEIDGRFIGLSDKFYIEDNLSKCQQVFLKEKWGVACLKLSDEITSFVFWQSDENGKWSQIFEREHDFPVSELTIGYNNEHVFSFEQSSDSLLIVNQDSDGNIFTTREIDSFGIAAKSISNNQYVLMVNEYIDEWENSRYKLVMFDGLTTDQKPYFKKRITTTIPTLYELSINAEVEDENTLPKDLSVEISEKPNWLEFESETLELKGVPLNSDVGLWPVTLIASDSAGQTVELIDEISVFLQSAQVNIFESNLFERLKIEAPLPLYEFAQQLYPIQILEDEKFEAKITVEYRDLGDVELEFESLPNWLNYDSELMMLSGTPEQLDVGESDDITVTIIDKYNEDEDRYPLIKMKIQVIEVDDTFTVLSDGNDIVKVGEAYFYQLDVDDEESSIADFTITPGLLPSWILFNPETSSLSGNPSEEDIGAHNVQVVLQDEVGHTVIHSFTVTVMKADDANESSGGSVSWGVFAMFIIVFFRKTGFRY